MMMTVSDVGLDFNALNFLWTALALPAYYSVKHTSAWVAKVKKRQRKDASLEVIKEFMASTEGQKILSDAFKENVGTPIDEKIQRFDDANNAKVDELKRDVGELASQVNDFINNYYSKLETLMIKLSGRE
jgi:DNA-binding transcriptional MerR regulator